LLGEPHWRIEWFDQNGQRRTADILPSKTYEIDLPATWTNPITAWPYWPGHNLIPGLFKPAGALFPFDVSDQKRSDGGNLCLSWKAGHDTVFYHELALICDGGVKNPANFDWPRFRELFKSGVLNEAVCKDPWLIDWHFVAEKTMESSFDRRRLVPESVQSVNIPVTPGPWYGTSPFAEALIFSEDETPVFPVRSLASAGGGVNVWLSAEGILRCSGKTWIFTAWE
jgi:hypothetical protein